MIRTLAFKRAAAIGTFVLILLGSSVPGKQIPAFFQFTPDKLIHCVEYLILGFMITRWLHAALPNAKQWKVHVITIAVGALCGITDELYQHLIPNRSPDVYDWCLDVTGVVLSIPAFTFWRRKIFTE